STPPLPSAAPAYPSSRSEAVVRAFRDDCSQCEKAHRMISSFKRIRGESRGHAPALAKNPHFPRNPSGAHGFKWFDVEPIALSPHPGFVPGGTSFPGGGVVARLSKPHPPSPHRSAAPGRHGSGHGRHLFRPAFGRWMPHQGLG